MEVESEIEARHEAQRAEVVEKLQTIKEGRLRPEVRTVIDYIISLAENFDPTDERFPYKPEIWTEIWSFIINFSDEVLTTEILEAFNVVQLNSASQNEALISITQQVFVNRVYGLVLSSRQKHQTIQNVIQKFEALLPVALLSLNETETVLLCTLLSSLKQDGVDFFEAKNPNIKKGLAVLSVITQTEILALTHQTVAARSSTDWNHLNQQGFLAERLLLDFFSAVAHYQPGKNLHS